MSDSLSPDEGPDPYEGQDLDGVLSGAGGLIPDGLRPVARTLDALRAAPMRAELGGEAAARAEFRKFMVTADAPAGSTRPVGEVRRPRSHRHRRPPQRGRWPVRVLVGVAAGAVVIAGAAAAAGAFSKSPSSPAPPGHGSVAASATPRSSAANSPAVEGNGKRDPAVTETPTAANPAGSGAAAEPGTLCRQYFASFADPGSHANQPAKDGTFQKLSALAGGPYAVGPYCMHLLNNPWSVMPKGPTGFPPTPGPDYLPSADSRGSHDPQGFNPPGGHQGGAGPAYTGNSGFGTGLGGANDQGGN